MSESVLVDTNVLVEAYLPVADNHLASNRAVNDLLGSDRLAVSVAVANEFVYVVTDRRRFAEHAIPVDDAVNAADQLLAATNVVVLDIDKECVRRAFALMLRHSLGRKRTTDTVIAAQMFGSSIGTLLTRDRKDFELFEWVSSVTPEDFLNG